MELTIDGRPCDLGPERIAVPGYDARKTATPESCREGRTLRIALPATPRNTAATGHPCEPHAAGKFNDTRHEAVLTAGGAELLRGPVRLLAATDAEYTLEIRSGGAGWAENAARRMFNTLGVEYDGELTPTDIRAGWTDGRPVKFFPVLRDEYPARNGPSDLLPAERVLSPDDYHPFLHVATLAERIFAEAGYRVESRFFASEFFRSLYMSGAYPSHDTAAAEARMGFSARRTAPVTAKANEAGKVVADPATALNSVGNIVETATPQSTDADGNPIDGLYNHGGCFSTDGGRILFTPLTETTAGFEYRLRYTTSHRILSRTRLRGFDTVYLGPGSEMAFTLANRYEDHRAAPEANRTYRALVFDHREGDGAVSRFDAGAEEPLGAWSVRCPSQAALTGEKVLRNPLFCPSLNAAGHYPNAPSARLLQVGDRDDTEDDGTNFTPRIVRYAGMHPLPEGERWGYPSGEAAYPLAAFHFAGDAAAAGFTLCFEDRDGVRGLHRFYDRQTTREARRERIALSLRLAPDEFAALLAPGTGAPDIRSVFRIDTGTGVVRALLDTVEEYDPEAASVRCTFTRLTEDAL